MSTQTGQNAAYNAKVREVAELLAKTQYEKNYRQITSVNVFDVFRRSGPDWDSPFVKKAIENLSETFIPSARAMVAKMADVFVQGMAYASPCAVPINTDDELKRRGLIPNTKTTE